MTGTKKNPMKPKYTRDVKSEKTHERGTWQTVKGDVDRVLEVGQIDHRHNGVLALLMKGLASSLNIV